ncbi:MAG TPA: DUF937 domain-containing protein [Luteitalea sp.]|nr:DUF937 domain-containing protein [Luteitalea sp.]
MNLIDQFLGGQQGVVVDQIGRQFGLSPAQTQSALNALLPSVAAGFQRNASSSSGLEGLLGALAGGQHQRYVEQPDTLTDPATVADGNGILGHIFGSKDVSREVAARASAQSGVGADILKAMLPMVAAMVMGGMAKGRGQGSGLDAGLGGLTGGGQGGGLLDMLTPMLDSNRDGSVVDDILGKFLR